MCQSIPEETIRRNLAEVVRRVNALDNERTVLLTLIKGYEGYLRFHASPENTPPDPPMPDGLHR